MSRIKKRLQIFVSSTYEDLKSERQAAVEAILTAGHIPAGMELFTSGDQSQMDVIKDWIDESDIFLLILAGRYGSLEQTSQKSYIHLEYEYANLKGKPLFACIATENAINTKLNVIGKNALETINPQKLEEFKKLVLSKMVKFWDDHKDIKITIAETLSHFSGRDDLRGWIQAENQVETASLVAELTRLSKENSQLREQLLKLNSIKQINGIAYEEMKNILKSKDLLNLVRKIRESSTGNYYPDAGERHGCDEICRLGLLKLDQTHGIIRYEILDSGRKFFNLLITENTLHNA